MRISDFLKGLNASGEFVAESQDQEQVPAQLTPAQQSISPGVAQTNPVDEPTPENTQTGETAVPEVSDAPTASEAPGNGIETSPAAEPTPAPAADQGDGDIDLSKGAEGDDEQDEENEGEDDGNDSDGDDVDQPGQDGPDSNPVDQADHEMEQEKQQYEESVTEKTFAEQFAASLAEGTQFKLEMNLDGLFESQGFEAEFATQAKEIFEAAVNDSAKQHIENVNKYAAYVMEQMLEEKVAELEESVEERLTEAVATWVESNRLAIEQGVRTQVAESFIGKLKNLLVEHYVEVPTAKKDMFEEKVAEVETLRTQLSEAEVATQTQVATLTEEVQALRKQVAIDSFVRGMTMIKAERIRSLAEGITFDTAEKFVGKLKILNESYVNAPKSKNADTLVEDVTPVAPIAEEKAPEGDPVVLALAKKLRT